MYDPIADITEEQYHRLMTLYAPPAHIKVASRQDVCAEDKPLHTYAYPGRKAFPCYSAPATYVSAAYFYANEPHLPKQAAAAIEQKLHDTASFFGIGGDLVRLRDRMRKDAQTTVDALDDSEFGIVTQHANGDKERAYPLRNPAEIKTAADWFVRHRTELPYNLQLMFANNIRLKAAAFSTILDDVPQQTIDRVCGFGRSATETITHQLRKRAALLRIRREPDVARQVDAWSEQLALQPDYFSDRNNRLKLAAFLDNLDRQHELQRAYTTEIMPPEEVACGVTSKQASSLLGELVETTTGNLYKLSSFASLPAGELSTWMGADFAAEVLQDGKVDIEKMASIVPTLPRDDAKHLDAFLQRQGATPFQKAAQSARKQTLQELAATFAPPPRR